MDSNANVVDPGELETQTVTSMDNVGKVLAGFGLGFSDVAKLNTYYRSMRGAEDLHANVSIRGDYFQKPGPASTGIPFPNLAYAGMEIEIEAIAMAS